MIDIVELRDSSRVEDRSWWRPLMGRSEVRVRDHIDAEIRDAIRWYRFYRAEGRRPHTGDWPEVCAHHRRYMLRVLFGLRRAGLS